MRMRMELRGQGWGTLVACGLMLAGIIAAGCGKTSVAPSASTGPALPADPIAQVVHEFLDAVRQGQIETASSRLTPLALRRTRELDMNFSPPGSPTAKFEVGDVELIEEDQAVVNSVWSDRDADGQPMEETILWALRKDEGIWRISGMAAQSSPEAEPVVIDFENPVTDPAAPAPSDPSTAPRPTDKVASDPFKQDVAR